MIYFKSQIRIAISMTLFSWSGVVFAQVQNYPMSVNSVSMGESVISAPASGMVTRAENETVTIKIHNSCFPTNLRGVPNPLAPNSVLKATFDLTISGVTRTFWVEYPASLVTASGMTGSKVSPMSPTTFAPTVISSAAIFGNTVILKTPFKTGVAVDSNGKITMPAKTTVSMSNGGFSQTVKDCTTGPVYGSYGWSSYIPTYGCGDYMGKSGKLTATVGGISVSTDTSSIDINVSYPGQTGFCGGYWSPLMVFLDEQRPVFDNSSDFPLNPGGQTMWPRADHPGWFVALDKDGSGLIDKKNELFGEDEKEAMSNGFEALKKLDSDRNGMIDSRDQEYKNLVLWKDKNGDGISQAEELIQLSKVVTRISLKYKKDLVRLLGKFAEERERSKFWYRDESGKIKKGDIIDIWMAPKGS
jgi:hypothetical protein